MVISDEKSGSNQANRRRAPSKPDRSTRRGLANPAAVPVGNTETAFEAELRPGLYLVATPIGNLADLTLRALAVLQGVDRIICEDTRVSGKLMARYGITTPLDVYHDHNAQEIRPAIIASLQRGARLALISDAGTPLVSDPGFKLVQAAIDEHLPITAVPGPSAAITALILSGLPPDAFLFAGFLPPRQAARRRALDRWAAVDATLIFYESTQRLAESLADMVERLGNRIAAVARELTKLHEEVRRGRLAELAEYYRARGSARGEAVVLVGAPEPARPDAAEVDEMLRAALTQCSVRDAAAQVASETGLARGELYRRALSIGGKKA
jgi:16S rRNA (cytidine1402-2'-O)-methyltransferase